MPYSSPIDARLLVDTALTNEQIESLIELADSDLDDLLGSASMSTILKKQCSMRLTACMIVENQPSSVKMGGLSMEYQDRATKWRKWVFNKVAKAVGRWNVVDELAE